MTTCPTCHQPVTRRDGFDRRGRQRFACSRCHRDFPHASSGAFSGYRWPAEVIVPAVRWYLSYPLSARQVTELLAERAIDVSARTVLTWTQTFGPSSRQPHGGIVVGLAGAGTSTRSSSSWRHQAVPLPRYR